MTRKRSCRHSWLPWFSHKNRTSFVCGKCAWEKRITEHGRTKLVQFLDTDGNVKATRYDRTGDTRYENR
jgi:hypothetical protein